MATSAARRIRRANDVGVQERKQRHAVEAYEAATARLRKGKPEEFFIRALTNHEIETGERDSLFDAAFELGIALPGMDDLPEDEGIDLNIGMDDPA